MIVNITIPVDIPDDFVCRHFCYLYDYNKNCCRLGFQLDSRCKSFVSKPHK